MDFRLVPYSTTDVVTYDFLLTPLGQLAETAELRSAVLIALGSDKLADASDILPNPWQGPQGSAGDRRGWWADTDADTIWGGWPIGSRLWLLDRAVIVGPDYQGGATITRVQSYIQESLQPFIDNRICSSVSVTAEQISADRIDAHVVMYRGTLTAIALDFQAVWDEVETN